MDLAIEIMRAAAPFWIIGTLFAYGYLMSKGEIDLGSIGIVERTTMLVVSFITWPYYLGSLAYYASSEYIEVKKKSKTL